MLGWLSGGSQLLRKPSCQPPSLEGGTEASVLKGDPIACAQRVQGEGGFCELHRGPQSFLLPSFYLCCLLPHQQSLDLVIPDWAACTDETALPLPCPGVKNVSGKGGTLFTISRGKARWLGMFWSRLKTQGSLSMSQPGRG